MRHSYLSQDRRSLQEVVLKFPHETVAGDVSIAQRTLLYYDLFLEYIILYSSI